MQRSSLSSEEHFEAVTASNSANFCDKVLKGNAAFAGRERKKSSSTCTLQAGWYLNKLAANSKCLLGDEQPKDPDQRENLQ